MSTDAQQTQPPAILAAALEYAALGWRVLPLRDGKIPRLKAWQRAASSDPETIERWWQEHPDDNLGVKLGPDSGIVDIECDTPEAERELTALFGGEFPITPTYSSRRGKHRLFAWRCDLPEPTKAVFHCGAIEVRTGNGDKGAQSVLPPSTHPSGGEYKWLVHPSETPLATIPNDVVTRLVNLAGDSPAALNAKTGRSDEHWERIAQGVGEGERNESAASMIGAALADLRNAFNGQALGRAWRMVRLWNRLNRPPLPEKELESTFRSILQREQSQRLNEHANASPVAEEQPFAPDSAPSAGGEQQRPVEWRLVIVESKPQAYRIYSPLWPSAPRGFIVVNSEQMFRPAAIRKEALEQANVFLTGEFDKMWLGGKNVPSLAQQLSSCAEHVAAPIEEHRDRTIAEMLLDAVARAKTLDEGQEPSSFGDPCRRPDGTVVFKFGAVWEPMARGDDRVKRGELSDVLVRVGATDVALRARGRVSRWKFLSRDAITRLAELASVAQEVEP